MSSLYFYYSAMNAGKTTNLLQAAYNYQERGMSVILLTPACDSRYGTGVIASRIGLSAQAIIIDSNTDLFKLVFEKIKKNKNIKCILIDEVHFLKKTQIKQLSSITIKLNLPVLAYGLRSDFRGEPFKSTQYLLAIADKLVEMKTICHCGRKATMNIRIDENGNRIKKGTQILVGGNERYMSVCRYHFFKK